MGFTLNQLEQERQIRKLQKKEDKDTKDYEQLSNLPKINNVELKGNKTGGDLGLASAADIATDFSENTNYTAGCYVYYEGTLYRFNADHSAGAWDPTDVVAANVTDGVTSNNAAIDAMDGRVTSLESAIDGYHVIKSVTADGIKTYQDIINELFTNVNILNLADVIMTLSGTQLYIDNNNNTLIDFSGCTPGTTAMTLTNILYHKTDPTKTSYRVCAIAQGSTTYTEYSSDVPTSGLVIALLTR